MPEDKRNRSVYIIGKPEKVAEAKKRVIELTDGSTLEDCHELVSLRHFVPLLAVQKLFPRPGSVCDELTGFRSVAIRVSPEEDIIAGFSTRGLDISGIASDVRLVCEEINQLVDGWVKAKEIVLDRAENDN